MSLLVRCLMLILAGLGRLLTPAYAQNEAQAREAWTRLQLQPITEATFRQACDLIQDVGQTNGALAEELFRVYVPRIQKTGNRRWVHTLLINWGDSHTLFKQFAEAEPIFRQARQNALANPLLYGQALVYTIWLYLDWNKPDSTTRYLALAEPVAQQANDRETLAFLSVVRGATQMQANNREAGRRAYAEAIRLATGLADKNPLFTARCNQLYFFPPSHIERMAALDSLLTLTQHPSLARSRKPHFYERTTYYHRNPRSLILYELIDLNLLLADNESAGRFADMLQNEVGRLEPNSPLAPFLNAQLAEVRCQQGQFSEARVLLDTSRQQFGRVNSVALSLTYFLAAGLLAEHDGQHQQAVAHYRRWLQMDDWHGTLLLTPPDVFYARALLHTGQYAEAGRVLATIRPIVATNRYTAVGLYYFQILAELRRAKNDLPGYRRALTAYNATQTWLTRMNQYRAVQRLNAQMRLREKQQQISRLNAENEARTAQIRRERLFYGVILALALLAIGLLVLYTRNRQARARQREALQQSELAQLEQQRQIDLMQGVMEAEANERHTIADQLHNEVNPLLAVVSLNVSSALETVAPDAPNGPRLRRAQDVLGTVASTVRGISHRLTPQLIEQQGFKRAIEDMAESINLSEKVRIDTIIVGFTDTLPVPFLSDLYRIVQELVHNVIRHAQATEATVEVVEHDHHVTIMVEDNGVGITSDTPGDGQGLQTIRAKVALRHGHMDVQHKPGGGTLVVIDNLELPKSS